jgi:FkbM family methyltransferase
MCINKKHFFSEKQPLERRMFDDILLRLNIAKPTQAAIYFSKPYYERNNVDFLRRKLLPGMTFVDIGAHIGYFSLLASLLVGKAGKVISFEPERHNYSELKKNIILNKCTNIDIYNIGLSDREGFQKLYINPYNDGGHSLVEFKQYKSKYSSISVGLISLDSFCVKCYPHREINFVKIDVEGHQIAVLQGMLGILTSYKPTILIEYGEYAEQIKKLLHHCGYKNFINTGMDFFCSG